MSEINVGWMIRQIRDIRGMTQRELAEKVGTRQNYISLIERGSGGRTPSLSMLGGIADVLMVPVGLLFLPPEKLPEEANEGEKEFFMQFQQTYYNYLTYLVYAEMGRRGEEGVLIFLPPEEKHRFYKHDAPDGEEISLKLAVEEIECVERKWPEGVPFPEFDELRFYKHDERGEDDSH